jgi:hypothetical protein
MKCFIRSLLVFIFSFAIFTPQCTPAFAQTSSSIINPNLMPNTAPDIPQNTHTLSQSLLYDVLGAVSCQLSGIDPTTANHTCLTPDASGRLGYATSNKYGLLGSVGNLIASTYNIPIHGSDFMAYEGDHFGLASKTYAANLGVGFSGIYPLINIWASFRNIVYLLFVVVFVLVGIAVMLRIQIDPRTVMTIENQLPRIIIGLILVTFSYAIAGLLIDLMWVFTYFGINVIGATDSQSNIIQISTAKLLENPIGYFNEVEKGGFLGMAAGGAHELQSIIANEFNGNQNHNFDNQAGLPGQDEYLIDNGGNPACNATNPIPGVAGIGNFFCNLGTVAHDVAATVGDLLGSVLGLLISWIVSVLAFLVIVIALLIAMVRTWFMLLKAYIFVLLGVIFAPFYIVAGLIPGSTIGFGSWFKGMAAHLLAFPVAVFMFVLIRVMYDNFTCVGLNAGHCGLGTAGQALFIPPLIGNPVGQSATDNPLGAFIVLGMIFVIPQVLDMTTKALQMQGVGIGAAIGGGFGGGVAPIRRVGGAATTFFSNPTGTSRGQRFLRVLGGAFGGR